MIFKNYKQLYETELANRKAYEKRYREKEKECQELQVRQGYAELRKQLNETVQELRELKMVRTDLAIRLEDMEGFKKQETEAKEVLKEQVKKLKKEIAKLKKELKASGK